MMGIINGKRVDIHFGNEGQIWVWDNGQKVVAASPNAREWIAAHVSQGDQKRALWLCKSTPTYKRAWADSVVSEPSRTSGKRK